MFKNIARGTLMIFVLASLLGCGLVFDQPTDQPVSQAPLETIAYLYARGTLAAGSAAATSSALGADTAAEAPKAIPTQTDEITVTPTATFTSSPTCTYIPVFTSTPSSPYQVVYVPPTPTLILNPNATLTPTTTPKTASTATFTPSYTATPNPTSMPTTDNFLPDPVIDIIPESMHITPGQVFTKTWKLLNNGTTTWSTDYALVFIEGEKMGAKNEVFLSKPVSPGSIVEISIPMTAPTAHGTFKGGWRLHDENKKAIGSIIWVHIVVSEPTPKPTEPEPTKTPDTCPPYNPYLPLNVLSFTVYLDEVVIDITNLSCGTDINLIVSGAITLDNSGYVTYIWEIDGVQQGEKSQLMCGTTILTGYASISRDYINGEAIPIKLHVNKPWTGWAVTGGNYYIKCN